LRTFFNYLKDNFFAEKDRFILWIPVLFGLGIGLYFLLPIEPSYWFIVILVEILLALLYIWRYDAHKFFIVSALLIVAFGFANIQVRSIYQEKFIQSPTSNKETTYLSGKILKIDNNAKGKIRLLLTDAADFDNKRKGLHRVTLSAKETTLKQGDCVELIATLMPPMMPVIPNGYQFNRKSFFEGLSAVGYANSTVFKIECRSPASFSQKISFLIDDLRKNVTQKINRELPKDEAAITSAILAGDRNDISLSLNQQYRDSGLAHFLSISGLHMSMIAAIAFFVVRLMISLITPLALKYDSKKIAAYFAIFMSFVYLLISGGEIPAQRAFIMTFVVLLGVLFSRNAISMRMLGFAAFIVLLISPFAIISASFQMSFAAVLVLIAFYERFSSSIHKFFKGKNVFKIIFAYIVGLLLSDLVASVATLPFAIYHFNRIAVYTTLGNLLAGPVIGIIIMPFVLFSLFLMPFNLYELPLKIVGFGINIVNKITCYVSSLPNAGYQVLSMPFWGLMLIVFGGLWLCIWQRKWRLWGFVPIMFGVLSMFVVKTPDVIFSADGKNIALKDNFENIVIMPTRGNDFVKQMWLEKTANQQANKHEQETLKQIYKGKTVDKNRIDLVCDEKLCKYKNLFSWDKNGKIFIDDKEIKLKDTDGGIIYIKENKAQIKSIRSNVGNRLWN